MGNKTNFLFDKKSWLIIFAVGLAYFIDLYEIFIFSAVREPSLKASNIDVSNFTTMFNWQLLGSVIGGFLWGMFADKKGRLGLLFLTILTYSLANIANAYVMELSNLTGISTYVLYTTLRFIAGFGLSGELGIGITYITETVPQDKRTYATAIVAFMGMFGVVTANIIAMHFEWKYAYLFGGVLGLLLLTFRLTSLKETSIFNSLQEKHLSTNYLKKFTTLFTNHELRTKFLLSLFVGLPIFFIIVQVLILNTKTYAGNLGADSKTVTIIAYTTIAITDIFAGILSKKLKSRKKTFYIFLSIQLFGLLFINLFQAPTLFIYYIQCIILASGIGLWGTLVTNASEQVGTEYRATATTSIPNLVRALLIPLTFIFSLFISDKTDKIQITNSTLIVGLGCLIIAFYCAYKMEDKFENNADFKEIN